MLQGNILNQTKRKMKNKPKMYQKVLVTMFENGEPKQYEVIKTVPLTEAEANSLNIHKLSGENVRYILAPEKAKQGAEANSVKHETTEYTYTPQPAAAIAKPKPVTAKRVKK